MIFLYALIAVIAMGIAIYIIAYIDGHRYVVREYEIPAPVSRAYSFVFITDMHDTMYEGDNAPVLRDIRSAEPDAVFIGGDFVNCRDITEEARFADAAKTALLQSRKEKALHFLEEMTALYPVYYAIGNHEQYAESAIRSTKRKIGFVPNEEARANHREYMRRIASIGCVILDNVQVPLSEELMLTGFTASKYHFRKFGHHAVELSEVQDKLGERPARSGYQIVLSHHPAHFPKVAEWGGDLVLSGHYHGGIMRLPFIGGVISPDPVLFPKYSGGKYTYTTKSGRKSSLITSCGLGSHSLCIRIFNPAELSVIRIVPDGTEK